MCRIWRRRCCLKCQSAKLLQSLLKKFSYASRARRVFDFVEFIDKSRVIGNMSRLHNQRWVSHGSVKQIFTQKYTLESSLVLKTLGGVWLCVLKLKLQRTDCVWYDGACNSSHLFIRFADVGARGVSNTRSVSQNSNIRGTLTKSSIYFNFLQIFAVEAPF